MLSRAVPRVVARRVIGPAFGTPIRRFTKGPDGKDESGEGENSKSSEPAKSSDVSKTEPTDGKIPVFSFSGGKRTESSIPTTPIGIVQPKIEDIKRVAMPFDKSLVERLTPTLNKFLLIGKIVVITGAARGLGFNMAQAMAEVGAEGIAIIDRQGEIGIPAAEELTQQTGVDVRFYEVDIRSSEQIASAIGDIQKHYGKIDVLINSAGIADGAWKIGQAVARNMIQNETPGSIVYIASMSGSIVNYPQEQAPYNISKAGVIHMTHSLAAEWAKYGIRINSISPGYMDTALNRVPALDAQKKIWIAQTPQQRLGAVDELNNLAVFLASDASSYMTGSNCIIDGGYCLY